MMKRTDMVVVSDSPGHRAENTSSWLALVNYFSCNLQIKKPPSFTTAYLPISFLTVYVQDNTTTPTKLLTYGYSCAHMH